MAEEDQDFIDETEEFISSVDEDLNPKENHKTLEGEDPSLVKKNDVKTAERYQDILVGLGFTRYDNKEKGITCKYRTKEMQIGRNFTSQYPLGKFWARCLEDSEFGKKGAFVNDPQLKEVTEIGLFYRIRDGELNLPEEIKGKVIGKIGKAIQIQFVEFNQIRTECWGLGAVKRNKEGVHFIAAGFSKKTEKYPFQKMTIPRDIILPDYEEQLENAPVTATNRSEPQSQQPEEDYVPDEVMAKEDAKELGDVRSEIIDDLEYFLNAVEKRLMPIFKTDEMTQAEYNERLSNLAISAGIENGYRIRERNRRY